jgi:regulator of protease activity HflC (stomatin/prohibitin superfamily)
MFREKEVHAPSGWPVLVVLLPLIGLDIYALVRVALALNVAWIVATGVALAILLFLMFGYFMVHPNQGKVLQLFGAYKGTARTPGLRWTNPLYMKRRVSLRIRNFETGKLKVNDKTGNPIEIGCVVVWKVVDTAEAVFEVDDFENFVHVQSEAALRNLATGYPYYVPEEEGQIALVSHTAEISSKLKVEIQDRLKKAGVEVLEARISFLAYAPEIAAVMLRRQQATAVIAARQKIVEGAVGMVEMALHQLSRQEIVDLDEERKAAMVSNLMVVLCSEQSTQPVVNTGTLHH